MRTIGTALAVLLALAVLAISCSDDTAEAYAVLPLNQLNLATPEATLLTFTERIEAGDMRNAALILDPALLQAAELRAESPIVRGLIAPRYIDAVLTDLESLRPNTKLNIARAEFILTYAAQQGGLPVDLIGGIRGIELLSVDADGAALRGILNATGEPVDALMVQVQDETWRLHQLLVEGGDPDAAPLSGPHDAASTPLENRSTLVDRLPMSTPTETVESLSAAFDNDDWHTFLALLHPDAQEPFLFAYAYSEGDRFLSPVGVESLLPFYDDTSVVFNAPGEMLAARMLEIAATADGLHTSLHIDSIDSVIEADGPNASIGVATVTATAGGEPITIELERTQDTRWRIQSIVGPGGDTTLDPWTAGPRGFEIPLDAELCAGGIVYWACPGTAGAFRNTIDTRTQEMIDELQDQAANGEITADAAASNIAGLFQNAQLTRDFDRLCAQIQGAVFANEAENRNDLTGEWLVENVCPGDPALLPG